MAKVFISGFGSAIVAQLNLVSLTSRTYIFRSFSEPQAHNPPSADAQRYFSLFIFQHYGHFGVVEGLANISGPVAWGGELYGREVAVV